MARKTRSLALMTLLGMFLAAAFFGCAGPQQPPSPKMQPASPIQIPAPPAVSNPSLFAYLKLRDPNKLIERVGEWVSIIQPTMNGAILRSQLQLLGVVLSEFRSGANLGIFLFDPGANFFDPPVAGLFPVPFNSMTARTLSAMMKGDNITSHGGHVIIAKNKAGLALAVQSAGALETLNNAPMPVDAQFFANAQAIMDKYKTALRAQIQTLQSLIGVAVAQAKQGGRDTAKMQRMLGVEMEALLDLLEQTKSATIGIDFAPEALDFSLTMEARPATGLAGALTAGPVSAPDLTQYLDKRAIVKAQQEYRDIYGFAQVYMRYLSAAAGPGQEPQIKQMMADLEELKKVGKVHQAIAFNLNPDGKLVYEGVMVSDDNKRIDEFLRTKALKWANPGGFAHDFYKSFGVEITIKEDSQTRKLRGWPVHRYTITFKINPELPARDRAMMEKMLGNLNMETCLMGDYFLFSVGQPIEQLADRLFAQGNQPIQAKRTCPPGGVFYAEVDLPAFFTMMKSTMPPEASIHIPNFSAGAPPVAVCGYHQNGALYYRLMVPKGLVQALAATRSGQTPAGTPQQQATPAK